MDILVPTELGLSWPSNLVRVWPKVGTGFLQLP